MKKLIIILLSVLLLASCGGGDETSQISQEQSAVSQQSSADVSVEQSTGDASPDAVITADEVQTVFQGLLQKDVTLMGIFAGGTLGEESQNYADVEGEYAQYSALEALAKSVYGETEVYTRMLSYPDYGEDTVINREGVSAYKYSYVNGFAAAVKSPSFKVVSYDDTYVTAEVSTTGGKYTLTASKREDGAWYLDQSLYFAYLDNENEKQLSVSWEESVYLGSRQNAGSLKKLSGKILLLNVFLGDSYSQWNEEKAEAIAYNVKKAAAYLEDQTKGLEISVTHLHYIHNSDVPTVYSPKFLEDMFAQTVYGSTEGYAQKYTDGEYDGVMLMFHLDKRGTGYTLPYDTAEADFDAYKTERAVFLYGNSYGRDITHSSAEYAHAILRLAGGERLYESDFGKELSELFPDDVMSLSTFEGFELETCSLSPVTKFLTGINGYIDTQLIPYTDMQREQ